MGSKRKRGAKDDATSAPQSQKRVRNGAVSVPAACAPRPDLSNIPFVETPTIDERKREGAVYELLGSEDDTDRIEAADCLVSGLLGGDDGVPEVVLQRHLDRRLFRGLSSGRNASRLGFSLVITEILSQLFGEATVSSQYPGLTFDKILSFLTDKAQVVGNVPGQEERDVFFGQLFGIECFVKAKILFAEPSRWTTILGELIGLGNRKVWLRSQCGWVLVQALEQMRSKQVKDTLERLSDAGWAKTPEGVAVWLVALSRFPDLKVKPWGHPLATKSLGDLTAVLRESFTDAQDPAKNNKTANWTAQLHFVWDVILGHYVNTGEAGTDDFSQFWGRVVDDGLFSKQATDGQKFKGFMVFQRMLEGLVGQHAKLRVLFSKNLMTCLMNQAAKEDRYLHRAAVKALKAVEAVAASHTDSLAPLLEALLAGHGAYSFDQRTSTKTIDRLLQNLDPDNGEEVLRVLQRPMAALLRQEDGEAQTALRTYIDYLSKILATPVSTEAIKPKANSSPMGFALQELSRLGYAQPKDIPQALLTQKIRDFARSRLESSLAKLTRQTDDFASFCRAVASIDSSSVTMSEEIKSAIDDALSRMIKFLEQEPAAGGGQSLTQGLAMLHAISIFQLYNEDPDAMEVLDDLAQFHERLEKSEGGEEGAGSSEFLVEILLSMVSRPSSLLRQVSQRVFEAFTGQISAGGLELLTGPLAAGESTKGQQELFNLEDDAADHDEDEDEDEDEDGDDEEASVVEIDSDVEFVDLQDVESDSESEGQDSTQGPQDLDELVGKILQSHRLDKDAGAESSEADDDMSDSEMLALDDKLAEVFRQRVKARPDSKKEKKEAKQSVVNFKHRILDFLDIYVKNETVNPLAFALLLPVLGLMRTTSTKTLASRSCEVILNYQKNLKRARGHKGQDEAKEGETTAASTDELIALLAEVHEAAGKDVSHAYAKAASAASLIVTSAMFAADRESVGRAAAVYAKTQADWVLGKVRLQTSFFADWNNWCQNHAKG